MVYCEDYAELDFNKNSIFEKIIEYYMEAKETLQDRSKALESQTSTSAPTITQATTALALTKNVMRQIQLPRVDLPAFDGDPLKLERFRDLFKSTVIDVSGLSNSQRLLYLQSRLSGEAAELIENTSITDHSFSGAWENLEAWYGNPRIIFSHHMKNSFSIPPAQRSSPSRSNT